jgi:hypothetical protein
VSKLAQAHLIARMVLTMLHADNAKGAHMMVARCGIDTIELIEKNADLVLRMQTEEGALGAITNLRFWLYAARENMPLQVLVDETPEEAINRKKMDDCWADINTDAKG